MLYDQVLITGNRGNKLVTLKGIETRAELSTSDTLRHLKEGSLDGLTNDRGLPGVIAGIRLAQDTGITVNSAVTLISPQERSRPSARSLHSQRFRARLAFFPRTFTMWMPTGRMRR